VADPSEALRHMAATRNAVANLDRAEAAEAEVDRLRAVIGNKDGELYELRKTLTELLALLEEAADACSEVTGHAFIRDRCACGDTINCGVCHMVARADAVRWVDAPEPVKRARAVLAASAPTPDPGASEGDV